ncbi:hypothetical protein BREU_0302 [Bifidobacterium reuteri DSM 23975]|uniref:Uncharacterized protein n=1 Tax=Bifidobacterium reuteri DSM 23975 TaxID=1437610 RepID=A0A087CVH1_9BIFI|nr:hypothetical protein BREU_0302 [Bifidobacterium reuteri DSM 23975]
MLCYTAECRQPASICHAQQSPGSKHNEGLHTREAPRETAGKQLRQTNQCRNQTVRTLAQIPFGQRGESDPHMVRIIAMRRVPARLFRSERIASGHQHILARQSVLHMRIINPYALRQSQPEEEPASRFVERNGIAESGSQCRSQCLCTASVESTFGLKQSIKPIRLLQETRDGILSECRAVAVHAGANGTHSPHCIA